MSLQIDLFSIPPAGPVDRSADGFLGTLETFIWNHRKTSVSALACAATGISIPVFTNEFWTSRQRAAHSLHEISYRACFKPQLPRFFIDRLTHMGDVVYDPFVGRGTTLLEAALLGRVPAGCDVNPLSGILVLPRLAPPTLQQVRDRLDSIDLRHSSDRPEELLTFYHPDTLDEICALREHLLKRQQDRSADEIDDWIRMVAVNRLTGHSRGFLSVYTLPPNQAVSIESQRKINETRKQTPPRRELRAVILRKTALLLADVDDGTRDSLRRVQSAVRLRVGSSDEQNGTSASVQLVVTSPPFLDVVNYASDNWLRCWFCGIDAGAVPIAMHRDVSGWAAFIHATFAELTRLLEPGGFVAFEVGEVRSGTVRLEETVVGCGATAGLTPMCLLVNQQRFTKTANIWGVSNNAKGTNSNRVVVFQKP